MLFTCGKFHLLIAVFKKITLTFSSITVLILLVSIGACNSTPKGTMTDSVSSADANVSAPGTGVTVRPSNSDWIEEQFLTEIVNIGLEKLGYEVEDIQQADYAALHVSMANDELDYTTGFYDPVHDSFFDNAGGDEKLEIVGEIVLGGGIHGILVDKKTADTYEISSLEQLQNPDIAQLFDTDGDGKANVAGCPAGWKCSELIDNQIKASGLEDTVQQDQGAYAALIADMLARQSQEEPVLYYAYSPHWLLSKLKPGEDVTWLAVSPTESSGDAADPTDSDTTNDSQDSEFPTAKQRIVASQTFIDENPVARRFFEIIAVPVDDLNRESAIINDGEDSPDDIRRHAEEWIDNNSELFEGWLQEAQQTAR